MPEALEKTTETIVAFGDVVRLSKERSRDPESDGFERYIGLEHLEPGDLEIRNWGDVSDGVTFTSVFRPGQVLFGKRRAYQRKVAVAEFSGICSGDIYVLEPKGDQLLPELLPFICQSEPFYDYVISMSQGGLSPRVNWKALAKYEFALPPMEEQRRIAQVLNGINTCRNATAKLLAGLNEVRRALLAEFLSPSRHGKSNGTTGLTDLCRIRTGKLDSNAAVEGGEFPFFTCDPEPKQIDVAAFDCDAVLLPGNNAQGIFWVKTYNGKFNAYQRTYVIEVDEKRARTKYIAVALEHQLQLLKTLSIGSTTKYLTMKLLAEVQIYEPLLEEQDLLLEQVSDIESARAAIDSRLQSLDRLSSQALAQLSIGED